MWNRSRSATPRTSALYDDADTLNGGPSRPGSALWASASTAGDIAAEQPPQTVVGRGSAKTGWRSYVFPTEEIADRTVFTTSTFVRPEVLLALRALFAWYDAIVLFAYVFPTGNFAAMFFDIGVLNLIGQLVYMVTATVLSARYAYREVDFAPRTVAINPTFEPLRLTVRKSGGAPARAAAKTGGSRLRAVAWNLHWMISNVQPLTALETMVLFWVTLGASGMLGKDVPLPYSWLQIVSIGLLPFVFMVLELVLSRVPHPFAMWWLGPAVTLLYYFWAWLGHAVVGPKFWPYSFMVWGTSQAAVFYPVALIGAVATLIIVSYTVWFWRGSRKARLFERSWR